MLVDKKPDVCVLGLGYIGLPTAAVIARSGCKVVGVDVNQHVVDTINRGEIHIEEVDLDGLVQGVVARQMLRASTMVDKASLPFLPRSTKPTLLISAMSWMPPRTSQRC
jgi:UDP-N-acetyl-D-mannosaminuronic acid dehydrogenase